MTISAYASAGGDGGGDGASTGSPPPKNDPPVNLTSAAAAVVATRRHLRRKNWLRKNGVDPKDTKAVKAFIAKNGDVPPSDSDQDLLSSGFGSLYSMSGSFRLSNPPNKASSAAAAARSSSPSTDFSRDSDTSATAAAIEAGTRQETETETDDANNNVLNDDGGYDDDMRGRRKDGRKPWRAEVQEELPFNDVNASIDVNTGRLKDSRSAQAKHHAQGATPVQVFHEGDKEEQDGARNGDKDYDQSKDDDESLVDARQNRGERGAMWGLRGSDERSNRSARSVQSGFSDGIEEVTLSSDTHAYHDDYAAAGRGTTQANNSGKFSHQSFNSWDEDEEDEEDEGDAKGSGAGGGGGAPRRGWSPARSTRSARSNNDESIMSIPALDQSDEPEPRPVAAAAGSLGQRGEAKSSEQEEAGQGTVQRGAPPQRTDLGSAERGVLASGDRALMTIGSKAHRRRDDYDDDDDDDDDEFSDDKGSSGGGGREDERAQRTSLAGQGGGGGGWSSATPSTKRNESTTGAEAGARAGAGASKSRGDRQHNGGDFSALLTSVDPEGSEKSSSDDDYDAAVSAQRHTQPPLQKARQSAPPGSPKLNANRAKPGNIATTPPAALAVSTSFGSGESMASSTNSSIQRKTSYSGASFAKALNKKLSARDMFSLTAVDSSMSNSVVSTPAVTPGATPGATTPTGTPGRGRAATPLSTDLSAPIDEGTEVSSTTEMGHPAASAAGRGAVGGSDGQYDAETASVHSAGTQGTHVTGASDGGVTASTTDGKPKKKKGVLSFLKGKLKLKKRKNKEGEGGADSLASSTHGGTSGGDGNDAASSQASGHTADVGTSHTQGPRDSESSLPSTVGANIPRDSTGSSVEAARDPSNTPVGGSAGEAEDGVGDGALNDPGVMESISLDSPIKTRIPRYDSFNSQASLASAASSVGVADPDNPKPKKVKKHKIPGFGMMAKLAKSVTKRRGSRGSKSDTDGSSHVGDDLSSVASREKGVDVSVDANTTDEGTAGGESGAEVRGEGQCGERAEGIVGDVDTDAEDLLTDIAGNEASTSPPPPPPPAAESAGVAGTDPESTVASVPKPLSTPDTGAKSELGVEAGLAAAGCSETGTTPDPVPEATASTRKSFSFGGFLRRSKDPDAADKSADAALKQQKKQEAKKEKQVAKVIKDRQDKKEKKEKKESDDSTAPSAPISTASAAPAASAATKHGVGSVPNVVEASRTTSASSLPRPPSPSPSSHTQHPHQQPQPRGFPTDGRGLARILRTKIPSEAGTETRAGGMEVTTGQQPERSCPRIRASLNVDGSLTSTAKLSAVLQRARNTAVTRQSPAELTAALASLTAAGPAIIAPPQHENEELKPYGTRHPRQSHSRPYGARAGVGGVDEEAGAAFRDPRSAAALYSELKHISKARKAQDAAAARAALHAHLSPQEQAVEDLAETWKVMMQRREPVRMVLSLAELDAMKRLCSDMQREVGARKEEKLPVKDVHYAHSKRERSCVADPFFALNLSAYEKSLNGATTAAAPTAAGTADLSPSRSDNIDVAANAADASTAADANHDAAVSTPGGGTAVYENADGEVDTTLPPLSPLPSHLTQSGSIRPLSPMSAGSNRGLVPAPATSPTPRSVAAASAPGHVSSPLLSNAVSHLALATGHVHDNLDTVQSQTMPPPLVVPNKYPAVSTLTEPEIDKIIGENIFYSEWELAMGVKFAGEMRKAFKTGWRKRYFVLFVDPRVNPNCDYSPALVRLTHTVFESLDGIAKIAAEAQAVTEAIKEAKRAAALAKKAPKNKPPTPPLPAALRASSSAPTSHAQGTAGSNQVSPSVSLGDANAGKTSTHDAAGDVSDTGAARSNPVGEGADSGAAGTGTGTGTHDDGIVAATTGTGPDPSSDSIPAKKSKLSFASITGMKGLRKSHGQREEAAGVSQENKWNAAIAAAATSSSSPSPSTAPAELRQAGVRPMSGAAEVVSPTGAISLAASGTSAMSPGSLTTTRQGSIIPAAPGGGAVPPFDHLPMQVKVPTRRLPLSPHPQYFLAEFGRCTAAKWGAVPSRLVQVYPLCLLTSLITDSNPRRRGLEFSLTFQIPPGCATITPR